MKQIVYIGTYTDQPDMAEKRSEGIFIYSLDTETGALEKLDAVPDSANPSFMALTSDNRILVSVNETEGPAGGGVSSYLVDPETGLLTFVTEQLSQGTSPCYVSIDPSNRWALVANYSSGTTSVLGIGEDGTLTEAAAVIQHSGQGPNKERQEGPHAHCVQLDPSGSTALIVDLGLDRIKLYRFNPESGQLQPGSPNAIETSSGSGPRHITFAPDGRFLMVTNELTSTVSVFEFDSTGHYGHVQEISMLPGDYHGEHSAAHLAFSPNGRFLYASNRGPNSLAVYSVAPDSGMLTLVEHISVEGDWPRHFAFDPSGRFVLVANQKSDTVTVFSFDDETGHLTFTGTSIEVPRPVFIGYLNPNA